MNKRKTLAFIVWLLAFLFPLQYAIVSTDGVANWLGVTSFVVLFAMVFLGYWLWDSSNVDSSPKHPERAN